ncbi:MAG: AAA family ATPase [Candidatus Dadabacteria bacterium]|nr:AAA family ATPase [Candidatus Dadabacteria bacterium]
MLTNIERIDGLGIFYDYKKAADLEDFGRFNILYGMNGSGKTTLSRMFASFNVGNSDDYPSLKYKITSDEGQFKEGQYYPCMIRVFNSDYIDSNLGEIEGQLNPIFIIGKENKSLVGQIQTDEQTLSAFEEEVRTKTDERKRLEVLRGKKFTDIARIIASETSGQVTRTYRKPNAEAAFAAMEEENSLSEAELTKNCSTLRQKSLEKIDAIYLDTVNLLSEERPVSLNLVQAISALESSTQAILLQTSDSLAIQRLRDNPDIGGWIEQGLILHEKHSSEKCEYCGQDITAERMEALGRHFNQSDKLLKQRIESLIQDAKLIMSTVKAVITPIKSQLYDELQCDYQSHLEAFEDAKTTLLDDLGNFHDCLKDKLQRRTEQVPFTLKEINPSTFYKKLEALNDLIALHNGKTESFEKHVRAATNAIETHHLTSIREDVLAYDAEIKEIDQRLEAIKEGDSATGELGTGALKKRIYKNRQKVSNTTQAAARLTDLLQTFLGRNELQFEPEGEGYRILRNGEAAKRLSEGEKTAITFIYFIVQLEDQDFDLQNGIVVIDDPVSSLDSNSVYQAFSFLKNAIKNAKQAFLLTHNFDFLRLLLNWCKNIRPNSIRRKYYMLLCDLKSDGSRQATIKPLDKELLQNESEYSYLFKLLYFFKSDGTIAGSYHIPNVARKVLEAFLEFYYPGSQSMYHKLERVNFDENKKTALLKFANDLSHSPGKGFDPALVPETQNNVKYLLEMIETVSPIHYASLKASVEAI